jgi:predicted transposase/invertase (TIGR01784 family)
MGTRTLMSFDYAAKRLLRNKADYEVLEGFLSELFKRQIKIDSILESESNKENENDKQNKVDMLVKDENGELIIIEIQFMRQIDYFHRMLYGVSKTIDEHIAEGNEYIQVKKMYSVNIVYFDFGVGTDYVYHGKTRFTGIHQNDELQLSVRQRKTFDKLNAGDIFPEYYILKVNAFDDIAKDTLDEWIYYLKNSQIKDDFKAQGLQKANDLLNIGRLTVEEKRDYDRAVDRRRSRDSQVWTAKEEGRDEGIKEGIKKGVEKGMKKGIKEGMKEGIKEGLKEGLKEGEKNTHIKVVKKSAGLGLSVAEISTITGLSEEEIRDILSLQ